MLEPSETHLCLYDLLLSRPRMLCMHACLNDAQVCSLTERDKPKNAHRRVREFHMFLMCYYYLASVQTPRCLSCVLRGSARLGISQNKSEACRVKNRTCAVSIEWRPESARRMEKYLVGPDLARVEIVKRVDCFRWCVHMDMCAIICADIVIDGTHWASDTCVDKDVDLCLTHMGLSDYIWEVILQGARCVVGWGCGRLPSSLSWLNGAVHG